MSEVSTLFAGWCLFPVEATGVRTLLPGLCASSYVREYLIAYAPDEKPLWIVAVMHGRRSPRAMAAILRGRE
jgi:hypothetical protein